MNEDSIAKLPKLIGDLFRTVDELNRLFPNRPFTPDGHLVGSIGEVVAMYLYDLTLTNCSNEGFDALTSDHRRVEVKLTGGTKVSIASESSQFPNVLLVFQLNRNTGFREIYNGPFPADLCEKLKPSKRKVIQIPLLKLSANCPACKALTPHQNRSLDDLNRLFPNVGQTLN